MSVIVHTQVYNGGKTLSRAIKSVLNQTHTDFIYYISDNASTDDTAAIISEYAGMDKRICPVFNDSNEFYAYHDIVKKCCLNHPDAYWTMLDDDDEYVPEFLEKSLKFIKKNTLDMAACGFTAINEKTKQVIGSRQAAKDMIITGAGFCDLFPEYHTFTRNVCAKLFSLSLLNKCTFETVKKMPSYGGDTIFATEAFSKANRVGIISESLHNVYYDPASVSNKWEPNRADSNYIRDDFTREMLIRKCGVINSKNENFLHSVYLGSVAETLPVLLNPDLEMGFASRVKYLKDMINHEKTQELLRLYTRENSLNEQLRDPVINWLLNQNDCRKADGASKASGVIFALYPQLSSIIDNNALTQLITESPETVKQVLEEYIKLGL